MMFSLTMDRNTGELGLLVSIDPLEAVQLLLTGLPSDVELVDVKLATTDDTPIKTLSVAIVPDEFVRRKAVQDRKEAT